MPRPARLALPVAVAAALLAALMWACGDEPASERRVDATASAGRCGRAGLRVGLNANLIGSGGAFRDRQARQIAGACVRWAREELEWSRLEPRPGSFAWEPADRMFTFAARRGLRVLAVLNGTPRWAGPARQAMPRDPQAFARFAAAAAGRYGPGGSFWRSHPRLESAAAARWFELYNEPYLAAPGEPEPDPGAYARTVRAGVEAARAANREARFLLAGETTDAGPSARGEPWLEALYEADAALGTVFDAVAVHPYAPGQSPLRYTPGTGDRWQSRRIEQIRATLRSNGDAAKPVWITEVGWSTCRADNECVSEQSQARDLRELFRLARTRWRPWVRSVFVYHLNDFGDPQGKEGGFGVVRRDGSAKPALRVLRTEAGGRR